MNKWRMAETAQELQDKKQTFLSCSLPSHSVDSASPVLLVHIDNLTPWGPSLPGLPQPGSTTPRKPNFLRVSACAKGTQKKHKVGVPMTRTRPSYQGGREADLGMIIRITVVLTSPSLEDSPGQGGTWQPSLSQLSSSTSQLMSRTLHPSSLPFSHPPHTHTPTCTPGCHFKLI